MSINLHAIVADATTANVAGLAVTNRAVVSSKIDCTPLHLDFTDLSIELRPQYGPEIRELSEFKF